MKNSSFTISCTPPEEKCVPSSPEELRGGNREVIDQNFWEGAIVEELNRASTLMVESYGVGV